MAKRTQQPGQQMELRLSLDADMMRRINTLASRLNLSVAGALSVCFGCAEALIDMELAGGRTILQDKDGGEARLLDVGRAIADAWQNEAD